MTLYEIVDILKKIALNQPNIRSASDGSVYDALNNNPSVHYDVFHISQTTHQEDFETDYYGLQLFYISRLEDSLEDNRLQIQSIGKEILGNVIRTFSENFSIDYPTITYIPFTQRFNDLTAGVYCNVRLEVPKDLVCADDYTAETVPGSGLKLQDIGITITENGLRVITADAEYDGIGEIRIQTEVPQSAAVLQDKEVEYTENGSYTVHPDLAYDGLSEVAVSINVASGGGYDEGYEDGVADQKAKLSTISVTENGTYTRSDGYSAITVNVPQGQGYDEGYEDGEAAQKAKLVSTAVTENGTYTREDGYSAITVNVDDRYDEGYADGFAAGASACSGSFVSALTLNVDSAITDSGTATTTYSPSTAFTNIYYTSSDPTIATIDSGTGIITVLSNGTVTICAKDGITHLQDCKQVNVTKNYLEDYFTIEMLTSGSVKMCYNWAPDETWNESDGTLQLQYRINGTTWQNYTTFDYKQTGQTISVEPGDVVQWKATNKQYSSSNRYSQDYYHNKFIVDGNYKLSGNIMSLLYGDNFTGQTVLESAYTFCDLFVGEAGLVSVENLSLPATTLNNYCYQSLFNNCANIIGSLPELPATALTEGCYYLMYRACRGLTTAPELPATTLAAYSYYGMFEDCFHLNSVKCLATDISATGCTSGWVSSVAASGTFVKARNMSDWEIGSTSGIPANWTIIDNS